MNDDLRRNMYCYLGGSLLEAASAAPPTKGLQFHHFIYPRFTDDENSALPLNVGIGIVNASKANPIIADVVRAFLKNVSGSADYLKKISSEFEAALQESPRDLGATEPVIPQARIPDTRPEQLRR